MNRPSGHRLVTARHDFSGEEPLYATVVDAVSDALGVDADALGPLVDIFDPDAFDAFVASSQRGPIRVQFDYAGCTVAVDCGGSVTVVPPSEE